MPALREPVDDFLVAATVPQDAWHASGTLDAAHDWLVRHPEVAGASIYAAAVLGDDALVRGYLAHQPQLATHTGGPHRWDALTYLCFSRFLRREPARTEGFVRAAHALLEAGASANTGFMTHEAGRSPEWECALYGACGVAHNAPLTTLLLTHGADANDGEVTYHTPESYDNAAMQVLVLHGTLTPDSLATLLLRKVDWHDEDGIVWLLAHGADPNRITHWGRTALMQAIVRDNDIAILQHMLDAGADPNIMVGDRSAVIEAVRGGRRDALELFIARGSTLNLAGPDILLAMCALNNAKRAREFAVSHADDVAAIIADGGALLSEFAGIGNAKGIKQLLALGVPVDARDFTGNGYWDIAKNSTALHVAAWRGRPATVRLLIAHGADINALDGSHRTPLMLAVKACVDSHWTERRSPESVKALLHAGADVKGVVFPCGYQAVDRLLLARGASAAP